MDTRLIISNLELYVWLRYGNDIIQGTPSSETDDDGGPGHFRTIVTGPELTICSSVIKFYIAYAFWIFFKAMFHLKSKAMLALTQTSIVEEATV